MMADPAMQASVHYCYNCGHRIDGKRESCWYCGAVTKRRLRAATLCKFCKSEIPHGALKCAQCGEFQDGRTPAAPPPPQQIIYVVDGALLGGGGDRRLLPGQSVPPEIARRLSGQTVKAIESGRPDWVDDPGVRALPAPAGEPGIIEIEAQTTGPERLALPGAERGVVHRGGGAAGLPVRRGETPQGVASKTGGALVRGLGGMARWLILNAPGQSRPQSDSVDVEAAPHYRNCEECGTEILERDSFCYHCGHQYHKTMTDLRARRRSLLPVNTLVYATVAALVAWLAFSSATMDAVPRVVLAGAAGLLAVLAFFRRRSTLNQALSLAALLATLWAYVFPR